MSLSKFTICFLVAFALFSISSASVTFRPRPVTIPASINPIGFEKIPWSHPEFQRALKIVLDYQPSPDPSYSIKAIEKEGCVIRTDLMDYPNISYIAIDVIIRTKNDRLYKCWFTVLCRRDTNDMYRDEYSCKPQNPDNILDKTTTTKK